MQEIPMDWIDKIFNCMTQFYGDRWTSQFNSGRPIDIQKKIWQSGLMGLDYDSIRNALILCRDASKFVQNLPPHVMEFYTYAKNMSKPYTKENAESTKSDPKVVKEYMTKIMKTLGRGLKANAA